MIHEIQMQYEEFLWWCTFPPSLSVSLSHACFSLLSVHSLRVNPGIIRSSFGCRVICEFGLYSEGNRGLRNRFFFFCFCFCFLGLHPWHMDFPTFGVKLELQLPAYTRQRWVLNLLSEARDRTCSLMVTSLIHFCCTTMGTPRKRFLC